jgi:hypothetical protein
MEASKNLPSKEIILQTKDSDYYLFKTDILAGMCSYSTDKNLASNLETITAERARQIIEMNKHGEKPLSLLEDNQERQTQKHIDLLADADVSRFDKAKKKKKKKGNKNSQAGGNKQPNNKQATPNNKTSEHSKANKNGDNRRSNNRQRQNKNNKSEENKG